MLPRNALQAWYGSNTVDLEWLDKPSRHQFRWRLPNDRWVTAKRQFSSPQALKKELKRHGPRDVYVGTSAWLTPIDLPKRSDVERPHPVLIDHLVVFDIDYTPFCYRRLEQARRATHQLLLWLDANEALTLRSITYSGGKGFHLVFTDNDRQVFSIPDPQEREEAVRAKRQALLQRVLDQGFPVDTTVTADTRRIIRLPGSLHGTTGWVCTRVSREQLAAPLKTWVDTLARHPDSTAMRYWPYALPDLLNRLNPKRRLQASRLGRTKPTQQADPITVLQCSTQAVGTKGRSAFMAWVPQHWKSGHVDAVAQRIEELRWGPVHQFEHLGQRLLLAPRAIPIEQLAKEVAGMGWQTMSSEMKQFGHAWIDLHPLLEHVENDELLVHTGAWNAAGAGGETTPYSAAHLELLRRLGVKIDVGDCDVAGKNEPALRVATKA